LVSAVREVIAVCSKIKRNLCIHCEQSAESNDEEGGTSSRHRILKLLYRFEGDEGL
jgi:hypothetical protein